MVRELFEWDMRRHEALKDWLSSQAASVLVEVLMEAARNDDSVRVVLRCLAEPALAGPQEADSLRAAIQFLTSVPHPKEFPHQQSDQTRHRLNWMLFLLSAVLNHGIPADSIEAVEFALERSEILAEEDLDSEYWSDSVRRELLRMHRLACERAQLDAMALAVRWARMRRSSRLGWFDDFAQEYAGILGSEGLAAHQRAMSPAS